MKIWVILSLILAFTTAMELTAYKFLDYENLDNYVLTIFILAGIISLPMLIFKKRKKPIIKYVNNIPTLFSKENLAKDLPKKAIPFRGKYFNPDIGKLILGIRTLEEPNIMEQLANAAGMKYWDVYKVEGPKSVKNKMNSIAQPFFESRAVEALKNILTILN